MVVPAVPLPPTLARLLAERPLARMRPGLERVEAMLDAVGRPERRFSALHVAGTNGKGSVSATAASVLGAGGARVGLYTSPHLVDFRERIAVDGSAAPDEVLERCAVRLQPLADRLDATYFEVATALAFLCFAELEVDVAVVETGLGGRLDATNVLDPVACAITGIARDHEEWLGGSLRAIAREKAGILKPDTPAAVAALPAPLRRVVEEEAARRAAPLAWLGEDARVESVAISRDGTTFVYRSARFPRGLATRSRLIGAHQAHNAGLALLMLEQLPAPPGEEAVHVGLSRVRLPGRAQLLTDEDGGLWVLDIAHNPEGVRALGETVAGLALPEPRVLLLSILADKPWRAMVAEAMSWADAAVLTVAPSAPRERRWDLEEAARFAEWRRTETSSDFAMALRRARELAAGGTVVVTGSAHTVGDATQWLAHAGD